LVLVFGYFGNFDHYYYKLTFSCNITVMPYMVKMHWPHIYTCPLCGNNTIRSKTALSLSPF